MTFALRRGGDGATQTGLRISDYVAHRKGWALDVIALLLFFKIRH